MCRSIVLLIAIVFCGEVYGQTNPEKRTIEEFRKAANGKRSDLELLLDVKERQVKEAKKIKRSRPLGTSVRWFVTVSGIANYLTDTGDGIEETPVLRASVQAPSVSESLQLSLKLFDKDGQAYTRSKLPQATDGDRLYIEGKVSGFGDLGDIHVNVSSAILLTE